MTEREFTGQRGGLGLLLGLLQPLDLPCPPRQAEGRQPGRQEPVQRERVQSIVHSPGPLQASAVPLDGSGQKLESALF